MRLAVAALCVTVIWAAVAVAAGGELDPSFSGDGWLRTLEVRSPSSNYLPAGAEDIAVQPHGKILAVGDFGTGADWAGAVALQRDGRIVVAGSIY
jgi:hypothetical protein